MGTQIQSETVLLGYCSKRDLNVHMSNGMWMLYDEEKPWTNSQQYASSIPTRRLSSGYDKEKVREIMMKHESIFRHQVQELHRLYRRQKELINEMKARKLHIHQKETERSQLSLFSSKNSFEDAKITWHGSHVSSLDSRTSQFPSSGTCKQSLGTVLERKSLLSPFAPQRTGCLEKHESDIGSSNMLHQQPFDLGGDFKPSLDSVSKCRYNAGGLQAIPMRSSGNMLCPTLSVQRQDITLIRNSSLTDTDGKTMLNNRLSDNGMIGKGVCSGGLSTSFNVERTTERQSRSKIFGVEIPEDDEPSTFVQTDLSSIPSWKTVPSYLGKKGISSQENHDVTTSGSYGSTSDLLPRNLKFVGGAVLDNRENRKFSSFKNEVGHQNGARVHPQLNSKLNDSSSTGFTILNGKNAISLVPQQFLPHDSTKCWNGVESQKAAKLLKADSETPNMYQDFSVLKRDPFSATSQSKALPWTGMTLDSLQKCSLHFNETETTQGSSQINVNLKQELNVLKTNEDAQGKKVNCMNSKKIFGFHIPEVVCKTNDIDPSGSISEAGCSYDKKWPNQLKTEQNDLEKGLNNCIPGLQHHIDLNLSVNDEPPSAPMLPPAVLKIATSEIDLEVPAVLETKGLASEADLREPKSSLDDSSETHQQLIRMAAEAIVSISSALAKDVAYNGICQPLEATSPNSLKWFAEVIFSAGSHQEIMTREVSEAIDGSFHRKSIPDGMDDFEFMTLKLKDAREESYYYKLPSNDQKDDEEPSATMIQKRPRRGQGRRGRHMKDFQRDVLPSLVSLSKHEVVEDLQTIEQLFRTSGCTWESGPWQRNGAKNGRRRRRAGGSLPSSVKNEVSPSQRKQPICSKRGLGNKNLPGWGKKTKRLPRQRRVKNDHVL